MIQSAVLKKFLHLAKLHIPVGCQMAECTVCPENRSVVDEAEKLIEKLIGEREYVEKIKN